MEETYQNALIAVDGGGTSCRIALLLNGKKTVVKLGTANVSTDFQGAVHMIRDGLKQVAAQAEVPFEALAHCSAYLGLAGLLDDAAANAVKKEFSFQRILVENDQRAGVVGALSVRNGFVAGIGTGTFYAHKSDAGLRIVGGWGIRLADEASGAWLGVRLLNAVLAVSDGLLPASPLTKKVFGQFDCSQQKIIAFSFKAIPVELAQLAPLVVEALKYDDVVALKLMSKGAGHIEKNIKALGWRAGEPLCLMGGLAPHYRPYLHPTFQASLIEPKSTALEGALQLAAQLEQQEDNTKP